MKRISVYVVLVLALCGLTAAHADIYTIPLTGDWLGVYEANQYWDGEVDFGVQFASIESVSILWSGTVASGLDDFLIPVRGRFTSSLTDDYIAVGTASGPWSPYSYSFPSASFNTQSAYSAGTWDFLLDGQATLEIDYVPENNDYTLDEAPWGDLDSATLIVYGTPIVPEPGSLLSVALGLGSLAAAYRRRAQ